MKCPRRSPDRFRKNGRSRSRQFYPSQAGRQQFFESLLPPSEGARKESANAAGKTAEFDRGIAILLLDAENLKLDINAEKFLAGLCGYPLQVKIAFANWKNPSGCKQDGELYDRGYELIHVPGGSNSADGKMIAFGAAILYRYRDVRQVFVCSSDGLLNHLCNQLQNQGLTVFRVRRQNAVLSVENRLTGDTNYYSCEREREIPSFEELANQIAELLKAEYKSIDDRIARVSNVAQLFLERHAIEFASTSYNAAAALQSAENEIYPAATKEALSPLTVERHIEPLKVTETSSVNSIAIDSLEALEKILVKMIEAAIVELKKDAIPVAQLKKDFFTKYQCHADLIVKKFLANSSLIKFFQSRPSVFKIELVGSEHQVATVQKTSSKTYSSAPLETCVAKIVLALTAQSSGSYIPITQVASEFHKQYGQPITEKIQALKLGKNFIDFLQSCQTFKVQKKGKDYQVAIALS